VFYNRAMAFDRDLNVAIVRAGRATGLRIARGWEMLAATGARGLRLVHEAKGFERFDLTERHPDAVEVLARNAARYVSEGARAHAGDAREGGPEPPYEYVDLDPYGTPVPFLEGALAAVADGGVLAVTATDQRVFAGAERGVAETRYGGRPVRGRLGPEGGLRLLLATVARSAEARGRTVDPLIAYVGDHHVRAYVEVHAGRSPLPIGPIDPSTWTGPPLGDGAPFGPLWLGPLWRPGLVDRLLPDETVAEPVLLRRWIERAREESRVDVPFFYESNTLAHALRLPSPPRTDELVERLRAAGHRAARSLVRDGAFRTDAPFEAVAELARRPAQSQNDRVRA